MYCNVESTGYLWGCLVLMSSGNVIVLLWIVVDIPGAACCLFVSVDVTYFLEGTFVIVYIQSLLESC